MLTDVRSVRVVFWVVFICIYFSFLYFEGERNYSFDFALVGYEMIKSVLCASLAICLTNKEV